MQNISFSHTEISTGYEIDSNFLECSAKAEPRNIDRSILFLKISVYCSETAMRCSLMSFVPWTWTIVDVSIKKKETFLEFKFEIPNSRMPLGKNFVSIEITTRCEFRRNVIRISRTHDVCTINDAFINNTLRNNTTFLIYKARMHA